jgi:hypothetical protein
MQLMPVDLEFVGIPRSLPPSYLGLTVGLVEYFLNIPPLYLPLMPKSPKEISSTRPPKQIGFPFA